MVRRAFSLGVTLEACPGGLEVMTLDRVGALGRTGRVQEHDVIVAINDVPVAGKGATELAALIHDGTAWYSGLEGVSTVTVRRRGTQGPLLTIVVNHLESDVKPTTTRARAAGAKVDLIQPKPDHGDIPCSDSVGIGITVQSDPSGRARIVEISPWGSARWTGKIAKNDLLDVIDGQSTCGMPAACVVALLDGDQEGHAGQARSVVELRCSRRRNDGQPPHTYNVELCRVVEGAAGGGKQDDDAACLMAGHDGREVGCRGDNLLAALHALKDMVAGRGLLAEDGVGGSFALAKRLSISQEHALRLHNVCGLWSSLATSRKEGRRVSLDFATHRAKAGTDDALDSGSLAELLPPKNDSRGTYHLLTALGHAQARADERMADLRRQEQELERDREAHLAALAEMAGDLAARKTEEGRRGAAQAAAVEEEICQARARRAAAEEELASAEAAAEAAAAARSEDRDMVQTEVDAVRESTVRTQAETRRLSTKQISLTDEHRGVVRARREATARLENEMQTACAEAAAAWPGEATALQQAELDAELRLERLRAQILSLRAAVQPHEARRGRLLDLVHNGINGAGSAWPRPGEDVRDTGAKGAGIWGGEDRTGHGDSREKHLTKQAVAQAPQASAA